MRARYYLKKGIHTALQKNNRLFVVLPILVNIVLFVLSVSSIIVFGKNLLNTVDQWLPNWLDWLQHLIIPMLIVVMGLIFSLSFTMLATAIASPFYGILSEKIAYQQGIPTASDAGLRELIKILPSALLRELHKIRYFLPRAIVVWVVGLCLPVLNIILGFGFNAWMLSLQYLDYPIDNQKQPFKAVRDFAATRKGFTFEFGSILQLLAMIPLVNLLIMPAAVCAATLYWCDQYNQPTQSPN